MPPDREGWEVNEHNHLATVTLSHQSMQFGLQHKSEVYFMFQGSVG